MVLRKQIQQRRRQRQRRNNIQQVSSNYSMASMLLIIAFLIVFATSNHVVHSSLLSLLPSPSREKVNEASQANNNHYFRHEDETSTEQGQTAIHNTITPPIIPVIPSNEYHLHTKGTKVQSRVIDGQISRTNNRQYYDNQHQHHTDHRGKNDNSNFMDVINTVIDVINNVIGRAQEEFEVDNENVNSASTTTDTNDRDDENVQVEYNYPPEYGDHGTSTIISTTNTSIHRLPTIPPHPIEFPSRLYPNINGTQDYYSYEWNLVGNPIVIASPSHEESAGNIVNATGTITSAFSYFDLSKDGSTIATCSVKVSTTSAIAKSTATIDATLLSPLSSLSSNTTAATAGGDITTSIHSWYEYSITIYKYHNDTNTWEQSGQSFNQSFAFRETNINHHVYNSTYRNGHHHHHPYDFYETSISLSENGNLLAIGVPRFLYTYFNTCCENFHTFNDQNTNDTNNAATSLLEGEDDHHGVEVYQYLNETWSRIDQKLQLEVQNQHTGGSIIHNNTHSSNANGNGTSKIITNNGDRIYSFGSSVSLSKNGNYLAIGTASSGGDGAYAYVNVYNMKNADNEAKEWVQIGDIVSIEIDQPNSNGGEEITNVNGEEEYINEHGDDHSDYEDHFKRRGNVTYSNVVVKLAEDGENITLVVGSCTQNIMQVTIHSFNESIETGTFNDTATTRTMPWVETGRITIPFATGIFNSSSSLSSSFCMSDSSISVSDNGATILIGNEYLPYNGTINNIYRLSDEQEWIQMQLDDQSHDYDGDNSVDNDTNETVIKILLTKPNIADLMALTERYIYVIQGLAVNKYGYGDESLYHPCTPGLRSRWELKRFSDCNITALHHDTNASLFELISQSGNDGRNNVFIKDIYFPEEGSICNEIDIESQIEIEVHGYCWRRVHDDHLSVFDVSF